MIARPELTLADYKMCLDIWQEHFSRWEGKYSLQQYAFWKAIGEPWFNDIARAKAEEYGIEGWTLMGSRALLINVNAGYFRWKQIMTTYRAQGHIPAHTRAALEDALKDTFGYATMYSILVHMSYPPSHEGFPWESAWVDGSPRELMEAILDIMWDQGAHNRILHNIPHQLAYTIWLEALECL